LEIACPKKFSILALLPGDQRSKTTQENCWPQTAEEDQDYQKALEKEIYFRELSLPKANGETKSKPIGMLV